MPIPSLIKDAVNRLVETEPGWKPFVNPAARGGKDAAIGKGLPGSAAAKNGGGDLIEQDIALRESHTTIEVPTSDGRFTLRINPLKSMSFTNGQKLKPADPSAVP